MTDDEVRALLKKRCERAGSITVFAHLSGLSREYVSEVIHGREKISASICATLGLVRKVTYEPR